MTIRQAIIWLRDTAFDLWQILHPERPEVKLIANHRRRGGSNAM
uniref:Uncharacterized protein n=1 Tax=Arundo donax TaxID=35708 RepID=A0A0A8ZHV6_ARUDO